MLCGWIKRSETVTPCRGGLAQCRSLLNISSFLVSINQSQLSNIAPLFPAKELRLSRWSVLTTREDNGGERNLKVQEKRKGKLRRKEIESWGEKKGKVEKKRKGKLRRKERESLGEKKGKV